MLGFFKNKSKIYNNSTLLVFTKKLKSVFLYNGLSLKILKINKLKKGKRYGMFLKTKKITNTSKFSKR